MASPSCPNLSLADNGMLDRAEPGMRVPKRVVLAAARSDEMMALLLGRRGDEISITEGVVNAAAACGQDEVLNLLSQQDLISVQDQLFCIAKFYNAAKRGDVSCIQQLLCAGTKPHTRNIRGETPLWIAAAKGYDTVVKLLIEHGANVNVVDKDGFTPLYAAAAQGHEPVVKLLLEHGANINAADDHGWTPLSSASLNGHVEVVKVLLQNAKIDPNSKDNIRRTPFFLAAWKGNWKVLELLLADTRVEPDSSDRYASTPLLTAVANGQEEVVDLLIASNCVNMDCKDSFGRTPLSWARRTGNAQIMKLLTAGSKKDAVVLGENEPIVEKEPLQNDEVRRWCDVCTVGILKGNVYHQCGVCNRGDFDICAECVEIGAHCLDGFHWWVEKKDG